MLEKLIRSLRKRVLRSMKEGDIDYNELKNKVKNGAKLVDVRSPQEYREGHLNEAIQIADYDIKSNVDKIFKDKNEVIVLYCQTGNRSRRVYEILKKQGYENVYNLYGGMDEIIF